MTKLEVLQTALKSAKSQVMAHLKANRLTDMKAALKLVDSLEGQLIKEQCQGKTAKEVVKMGYFAVVDKINGKMEVFKKLSQQEINNYTDWDCVVYSPVK